MRVAVHGEDRVDTVHDAEVEHRPRTAGHGLLGGLEDDANRHPRLRERPPVPVQGEGRAEQRGGVHVVAARVTHPVDARGEGQAGALGERQGVDVGPQSDPVAGRLRADLGDDTGGFEQLRRQPPGPQPVREQRARAGLLEGEFGVGVQVATDLQQVGSHPLHGCHEGGLGRLDCHNHLSLRGAHAAADVTCRT